MFNYRRKGEVFPLITPLFAPIYSKVIYCRTVPWKNVIHPFIRAGRAFSPFRYTSSSSIFLLFSCALAKKINGSPYFLIEAGAGVSERKRMSRGALALSYTRSVGRLLERSRQPTILNFYMAMAEATKLLPSAAEHGTKSNHHLAPFPPISTRARDSNLLLHR